MRSILMDLSKIFPMEPSELKISVSVESYDEKTADNYHNCYVARNLIVSKQSKISISNFNSRN